MGSVRIFRKKGIGLDYYKGKEFMSRVVQILSRIGNVLRTDEITQHWVDKGNRLAEVEPGVWIAPGF